MKEKLIKLAIAVAGSSVAAYLHELTAPAVILCLLMFSDYLTGFSCAWVNKALSSRAGIVGIIKKTGYIFVVGVGVAVDFVLQFAGAKLGIDVSNVYFFGLLVIVWLIVNECISILENVSKLGVPVPSFLKPFLTHLKQSTEKKGGHNEEQSKD